MGLAPLALEAEVEIAERAGKRDLPYSRRRIERLRRSFERGERARDFAGLAIEPALHRHLGRPVASLVDDQDAGIENAVRERFKPQRLKARLGVLREDAAATGERVEIFEHD